MKKTTLLLAGLVFATGAYAQTADEIINKHADAIGGRQKLAAIKNIYMEGKSNINGTDVPFKVWTVDKQATRIEFSFGGMTGYTIIRKDSGWGFSPFAGQTHPEPMTADQVKGSQSQLDAAGDNLIDYKTKGYKVTFEGKDDVDGTEAFKLQLKISDSLVETYYIDPESYYVIRVHTKETANGKVEEGNQDLSNYQKTADGYTFPMALSGGPGGDQKITTIKVNTEIDPNLFKPLIPKPDPTPTAVPNK
jgi:hypothetical protein